MAHWSVARGVGSRGIRAFFGDGGGGSSKARGVGPFPIGPDVRHRQAPLTLAEGRPIIGLLCLLYLVTCHARMRCGVVCMHVHRAYACGVQRGRHRPRRPGVPRGEWPKARRVAATRAQHPSLCKLALSFDLRPASVWRRRRSDCLWPLLRQLRRPPRSPACPTCPGASQSAPSQFTCVNRNDTRPVGMSTLVGATYGANIGPKPEMRTVVDPAPPNTNLDLTRSSRHGVRRLQHLVKTWVRPGASLGEDLVMVNCGGVGRGGRPT